MLSGSVLAAHPGSGAAAYYRRLEGNLVSWSRRSVRVGLMIRYSNSRFHAKLLLQRFGSVLPFATAVALPCAVLGFVLKHFSNTSWWASYLEAGQTFGMPSYMALLRESAAYTGFSALVGFFLVFRTQQAYGRFQKGATAIHEMRGEWFDAASSLIAFCKYSEADISLILRFQHKLIRLFSMLHAVALADLEGDRSIDSVVAFRLPLIDVAGIDGESLLQLRETGCKVELCFQWIQQLVVENIKTDVLSIPPPILTRAFQELANGMVKYHDAMVIAHIPFPFPYMQTTEVLLLMHWFFTPLLMCQWTTAPPWTFGLCFIQVFVLWSLNAIACELENPFGEDANDLDANGAQNHLNDRLLLLIRPSTLRTPALCAKAILTETDSGEFSIDSVRISFSDAWTSIERDIDEGRIQMLRSRVSLEDSAACMNYERKKRSRKAQYCGLGLHVCLEEEDMNHEGGVGRKDGGIAAKLNAVLDSHEEETGGLTDFLSGRSAIRIPARAGNSDMAGAPALVGAKDLTKSAVSPRSGGSQASEAASTAKQATWQPLPQQWSPRRWLTDPEPPANSQMPTVGAAGSIQLESPEAQTNGQTREAHRLGGNAHGQLRGDGCRGTPPPQECAWDRPKHLQSNDGLS